jgi:hypothetical protein
VNPRDDVHGKLDTVDVVVHLAGASSPDAAVENGNATRSGRRPDAVPARVRQY